MFSLHRLIEICQGQVTLFKWCLDPSDFDCHVFQMLVEDLRKHYSQDISLWREIQRVVIQIFREPRFDVNYDWISNYLWILGYDPVIKTLGVLTVCTLYTEREVITNRLVCSCLQFPGGFSAKSDLRWNEFFTWAVTSQVKCTVGDWALIRVNIVKKVIPVTETWRR